MNRLLVPIDFSDVTGRVVSTAQQLARAFSAKVWLLHCAGDGSILGEIPALPDVGLPGRYPEDYRKLADLTASLRDAGIDAELIFGAGSPVDKILAAAEEHQVDLIVLGSHGRGALVELLAGSVAKAVLTRAGRPTLIIPSHKP